MVKTSTQTSTIKTRPPIVAVLGHVDHGKTSLLDTIRKTHITEKEHGGITQHIGAYQIETPQEKRKITFIDTPGHEAFAKMRSRGAQVADIAILVVAATEGVKPQTEESIKFIKAAGIPIIVAANKSDLPEASIDRVKQQLAKVDVLAESFGGDVVVLPVSAKTGAGIKELLDAILLVADLKEIPADPMAPLEAVIIESKLDKHTGPLASVIVKNGTMIQGQTVYAENAEAKVRSLKDDRGAAVSAAIPGMPVEVMGWKTLPPVGAVVTAVKSTPTEVAARFQARPFSLPPLETRKKLKMLLKADVAGSLEAVRESLSDDVEIVHAETGEITESDILLAKSTGSVIIGFNLAPNAKVIKLAQAEKVRLKVYAIIYELIEEIAEVIEILNKPEAAEQVLGMATILAEFPSNDGVIAGCKVDSGRIARSDTVKILRKDTELARSRIKSMHRAKEAVPKAEALQECGILFEKKLDFKIGDRIIAYKEKELLA